MEKVSLDAKNQTLGRLASRAAIMLRGKDKPSFTPDKLANVEVVVKNLDKVRFTGNKLANKVYYHYSGYHSGIRARKLSELWATRPKYVLREMVYRMLPKNRTRDKIIKNLKFE